jgi:hypothetical protein
MPVDRLFVIAVLLCSPLAFAQDQQKPSSNDLSEALGIVRAPQNTPQALAVRTNGYRADDAADQEPMAKASRLLAEGEAESDTTCYVIRSYRVARDSPDSDSTHAVGSSTCQRASRYRLKSANIEHVASGR